MSTTRGLDLAMVAVVGIALLLAASQARLSAQPTTDPAIRIGAGDLGGVVASGNGPEAGVWVIAETTDLPTKFAKIVVTDDQGRYVMPDLPRANYDPSGRLVVSRSHRATLARSGARVNRDTIGRWVEVA